MVKWFIVAILLLPLAEIAAFVVVAAAIGLGLAFGLMILTTLLGALVLRRAGRGQIAHFRVAMTGAGLEAESGGLLTVLAGLLLLLPGFLTDLAGAALLLGPVQQGCSKMFRRWVARHAPRDRSVVDLAPEEWQQVPERKIDNDTDRRGRD